MNFSRGWSRSLGVLCLALLPLATSPAAALAASGHVFSTPTSAHGSARAVYRAGLAKLGFRNVHVTSAAGDHHDGFVEGYFTANVHGAPISGLMFARANGRVAGAFDTPSAFPHTETALLAKLQRMSLAMERQQAGASGGAVATLPLHTVSFGTGTVGLPDTWRVLNSYQGCVEASSQAQGGYEFFGCPQLVDVPPGLPGAAGHILMIPYTTPQDVFVRYAQTPLPLGLGFRDVNVLEVNPIQPLTPNGRAAYVLFTYSLANGTPCEGFILVNISPASQISFSLYKSGIFTQKRVFNKLAPTLWKSWKSWTVNQSVFSARLASAAQSMREAGQILTGVGASSSRAMEGENHGFDQYIRDTATVEDTTTGARAEGSAAGANALVEHDPTKYEIVPGSRL